MEREADRRRATWGLPPARGRSRHQPVRLACRCGKRIEVLTAHVHPAQIDGDAAAVLATPLRLVLRGQAAGPLHEPTRTWRCPRCGHSYPVTAARLLAEFTAAARGPGRVIQLPLGPR